jgi:hypothetical protein
LQISGLPSPASSTQKRKLLKDIKKENQLLILVDSATKFSSEIELKRKRKFANTREKKKFQIRASEGEDFNGKTVSIHHRFYQQCFALKTKKIMAQKSIVRQ